MPRTTQGEDPDDGEEFDDYEAEYHPEADDAGELWCPKCGAVMYAGADLCPKCNQYVTPGARPSAPMPVWMWAIGVGIIVLVIAGLVGALIAA